MADVVKIVNNGLAIITNRMIGAGTEPKYVHWGTEATAALVTDSALGSPSAEDRVLGTGTRATGTATGAVAYDTYIVTGQITSLSTQAITEVGLFDNATTGSMFLHGTFDAINLNEDDAVEFTIKTTFSDGS